MAVQSTRDPAPQPVLSPLTAAAVFLVLTIDPGGEQVVNDFLADLSGLQRSVAFRLPEGKLQAVAAIGSDAWDRLFAGPRPRALHPFRELAGPRHRAPATPGDLLFHKLADIELPDDIKPANSHVALNTVNDADGDQLQIVRANMPFGNPGRAEFGTYFISYAAEPAVTEEMLTNMFIGRPPGNTDRILDFSTAITGGNFFAPSADFLDSPPGPPSAAGTVAADATPAADAPPAQAVPGDGSLGIGSLSSSGGRPFHMGGLQPPIPPWPPSPPRGCPIEKPRYRTSENS